MKVFNQKHLMMYLVVLKIYRGESEKAESEWKRINY